MLRVPKAPETSAPAGGRSQQGQPLALPRAIGNRGMLALVQRRPVGSDVIRDLRAAPDPEQWSQNRSGDIDPQLIEIATLAQANKLRTFSIAKEHIGHPTSGAKLGATDVKPGLNFSAKLAKEARAETGFVDGEGVYRGRRMPVTLDGALPRIAITLAAPAFHFGKDSALATMRHEMEHAAHMQMMIDRLAKWRAEVKAKSAGATLSDAAARTRFDAWVSADKTLSKVDRALLLEEQDAKKPKPYSSELLAYLEGFMTVFHLGPQQPTYKDSANYPAAIEQLWGAAKLFTGASADVQSAGFERVREYYRDVVNAPVRAAFRNWMWWLIDHVRETPPGLKPFEASAAKKMKNDFGPHLAFLNRVLAVAREQEFAANTPANLGPQQRANVSDAGVVAGKPRDPGGAPVKVGNGQVEIRKTVAYKVTTSGTTPKKEGVSLAYTGTDTDKVRWLQFIWREVVAFFPDGSKVPQTHTFDSRPAGSYDATTDDKDRKFNTDSGTSRSPYYEQDTSTNRTGTKLTLLDEPDHWDVLAKKPFEDQAKPPSHVTSSAHLVDYLVRGTEVLYRAEIDMDWKFMNPNVIPPVQTTVRFAGKADRLEPGHRKKLLEQYPGVSYLP
jgi:hypothetical protein